MHNLQLNKSQNYAVSFGEGAMLVLAGPGSGKTAVITNRVLSLITDRGIPPENILVITFSRAAAEEMKQRFMKLGGSDSVTFGTFHAIFFKIVRDAYDYDISSIISEKDKNIYLADAMKRVGVTVQNEREFREKLSAAISMLKNGEKQGNFSAQNMKKNRNGSAEGVWEKNRHSAADGPWEKAARTLALEPEKLHMVYREYSYTMKNAGKIDFDDMMLLCLKVFEERPDILKHWQERFRFILIDEFQDINPLQYRLVKMLAYPENNIFAVGDDDQSIYGFRGASPKLMFDFEKDYKGCRRTLLDTNYRSGEEIVAGAARLIAHNAERFKKRTNSRNGPGAKLERIHFESFEEEMDMICDEVEKKHVAGGRLAGIAVLYRMNNQIRPLYNRLLARNIPCRLREKTTDIFEHWIADDVTAYLHIVAGSTARPDYLRIINRPVRYVGRDSFRDEKVCIKDLLELNRDRRYVTEKLEKLEKDIGFMKRLDVTAAIRYLFYGAGYGRFLKEYAASKNVDETELLTIFEELADTAKGIDTPEKWFEYIDEHREKVRKDAALRKNTAPDNEPDGVELMTFHRSKGLEFDTVYIIDASEGFTPQSRAETAEEIEEERRVFYVAATRARDELYICDADDRLGRAAKPSRFISEMGLL